MTWSYHRGNAPGEAVLWLTGVLGAGEFAFGSILALLAPGPEFRVLAPDYPALPTLDRMTDGLVAILDAERVEAAHVVASSFGGMLAQHLVRRHPTRVRSLVLSHTGPPGPIPGRAALTTIVTLMPEVVMKGLMRKRLRRALAGADPFWLHYFDTAIARMTKVDLTSRVRLASEFGQQRHSPRDLEGWPGRMLILDSSDDPLIPARTRNMMRALYPRAAVHEFSGTGHAAGVLQPELYAKRIRQFLKHEA